MPIPQWLQRTPEEEAEEQQVQELRRAGFGRARKTPEEESVSRGALLEETARGNLNAAVGDEEATQFHLAQLAYALSLQGRYAEAVEHEPNATMKAHYQSTINAIEMDDSKKCDCPDTAGKIGNVDISITPRFTAREVFSSKHGRTVSVVTCSKCGHKNARVPNSRIPIRDSALKQNIGAVSGRGLIADVQLLRK